MDFRLTEERTQRQAMARRCERADPTDPARDLKQRHEALRDDWMRRYQQRRARADDT